MGSPPAKTILLVEDDAEVRRSCAAALAGLGYRVIESDGVSVGYHLFQNERPDLVVLDVSLPDGTGVEFCRNRCRLGSWRCGWLRSYRGSPSTTTKGGSSWPAI